MFCKSAAAWMWRPDDDQDYDTQAAGEEILFPTGLLGMSQSVLDSAESVTESVPGTASASSQ